MSTFICLLFVLYLWLEEVELLYVYMSQTKGSYFNVEGM